MNSPSLSLYSMTGYGAASQEQPWGRLSLELRSVNGRFLDLAFRLPDELRGLEPMLRESLAARLRRGKVEVRAHWTRHHDAMGRLQVRDHALESLFEAQRAVLRRFPAAAPLTVADCLAFPGVIDAPQADTETLTRAFQPLTEAALHELLASRAREGQRLGAVILEHAAAMSALIATLRPQIPTLVADLSRRLTERLHEAATQGVHGVAIPLEEVMARVRQEVALYGMRMDVAEELERLGIHLAELQGVLTQAGPVGKRLDFLMQELNREANTLGSKIAGVNLGQVAIDLKVLIEQMREQVQNLE